MKVNELFEGKVKQETASEASARYEKFKKMLAKGAPGVTQQQVDGIKKIADSLWTSEYKAKEKDLIDVHGAEWWELARKQYPIKKDGNEYVVKSNFAIDPDSGKRGPWTYDNEGQAKDKVFQLVKWLDGGRKKGYGDKDGDIQKWFAKLDSVDKKKKSTKLFRKTDS
jgi:hypothetical protein